MVCLATLAPLLAEAVGPVKKIIATVLVVLQEQQMDRQTNCWILRELHEFTGIMARERETVLSWGFRALRAAGKHHYNSQQGSSKWLCSFGETF
jgi:hypothetical protein